MPRISRPVGLLLIAALLATVLILSLPGRVYWQRVLQDAGHGPIFAAVAVVLLGMRAGSGRLGRADYARAFAVAVLLGVGTELLQLLLPNRSVSALDVLHDAAGAMFGLAVVAGVSARTSHPWPLASLVVVGVLALGVLAWQPLRCARAYASRAASFPTLAPMGGPADTAFAGARNASLTYAPVPEAWHRADDAVAALRLDFAAGARPALELAEIASDWRGYQVIALDLTNPGDDPASFVLRILDAHHDWSHEDRLNLPVVVPPRTRTIVRVPLKTIEHAPTRRAMDLSAIANVMLFATAPTENRTYYVSRVWLE